MSGPFKMKGSSGLGYGNQHSKGVGKMYDSPAQKALVGDQNNLPEDLKAKIEGSPAPYATPAKKDDNIAKKKRVVEMNEKHAGKPGFDEYKNKVFGGETKIKGNTSTTVKPVKK
jgi:hypothetical protein